MTDREALHSMLIYAQREAEVLDLPTAAQLIALALADLEGALNDRGRGDPMVRADVSAETEFQGHFGMRRLQ